MHDEVLADIAEADPLSIIGNIYVLIDLAGYGIASKRRIVVDGLPKDSTGRRRIDTFQS